jgi:enamine deaminase RidA (YjgF/YER057c/UK114 family)
VWEGLPNKPADRGRATYGPIDPKESPVQKRVFEWHGQEFVALSDEARSGGSAHDQTRDIFERMDLELRREEVSLIGTVRTRLWARDADARNRGSRARIEMLANDARSASSSYIDPSHFETNAAIAVDLIAMKPASGLVKAVTEYDPPVVPPRFAVYGPLVYLSGVTSTLGTLAEQAGEILGLIGGSLEAAGSSWAQATKVSFYLQREETEAEMAKLFTDTVNAPNAELEYAFVEGYSAPDKRVEIEVTATVETA